MDDFGIPHDIRLNEEIWRVEGGEYNHKNAYWSGWCLQDLIESCEPEVRERLAQRVTALRETYDDMSEIYQQSKGKGAEIPLA